MGGAGWHTSQNNPFQSHAGIYHISPFLSTVICCIPPRYVCAVFHLLSAHAPLRRQAHNLRTRQLRHASHQEDKQRPDRRDGQAHNGHQDCARAACMMLLHKSAILDV